MAANTQPIFSTLGAISASGSQTAANTATDGTGTVGTIITANALGNNAGNFIQKIIARPLGTNVASVARIFWNNGGVNTTATNNSLIAEVSLPATSLSQSAAMTGIEIPINFALPPGHKLLVTLGTAVAAGWNFTAIAGQY
jgi:hypothetical protein